MRRYLPKRSECVPVRSEQTASASMGAVPTTSAVITAKALLRRLDAFNQSSELRRSVRSTRRGNNLRTRDPARLELRLNRHHRFQVFVTAMSTSHADHIRHAAASIQERRVVRNDRFQGSATPDMTGNSDNVGLAIAVR
jgi:hypothetical protein